MRILIDARMYGLEHAGIGRYVVNLVNQLQNLDEENYYSLLVRKNTKLEDLKSNFKSLEIDIPHYSLREQTRLPQILNGLGFDIAHFPHFNVPIFFNRPYVLTIHDLIKHTSRGMPTTTKGPVLYWLKYLGYKIVFGSAITRAKKIIVPSKTIKGELLKSYKIPSQKVEVIYEGVDKVFYSELRVTNYELRKILAKYKIKDPYAIYTGSAYPHKNLERLIQAIGLLGSNNLQLVIVSARNSFLDRVVGYARKYGVENRVKFLGFVEDSELGQLYANAKAFVSPSLSEGFGLPGLEAMASGCPVLCSDIPVFHEIYADSAIYFNPYDVQDIVSKINQVLRFDESILRNKVTLGKERAKQFSWRKMAEETIRVYKDAMGYNFGK